MHTHLWSKSKDIEESLLTEKLTPRRKTHDSYHQNVEYETKLTQRVTYEWIDNCGVNHVTAWSKAV